MEFGTPVISVAFGVLAQNLKCSNSELQELCNLFIGILKDVVWEIALVRPGRPFAWATAIKVPDCF
jgi:hypothetical protein